MQCITFLFGLGSFNANIISTRPTNHECQSKPIIWLLNFGVNWNNDEKNWHATELKMCFFSMVSARLHFMSIDTRQQQNPLKRDSFAIFNNNPQTHHVIQFLLSFGLYRCATWTLISLFALWKKNVTCLGRRHHAQLLMTNHFSNF